jgi:hypothetical protein
MGKKKKCTECDCVLVKPEEHDAYKERRAYWETEKGVFCSAGCIEVFDRGKTKCEKCGVFDSDELWILEQALGSYIDGCMDNKKDSSLQPGEQRVSYNEYIDKLVEESDEVYKKMFGYSYVNRTAELEAEYEKKRNRKQ